MGSATLTLTASMASNAAFRAWGLGISGGLSTVGMVQTSDTGQINWTTAVTPGTTFTSAGYEIWRFADTLQSTAPIYFKMEYGCANPTSIATMWITLGTGSDGAGTITGTFFAGVAATSTMTARVQVLGSSQSGTTVYVNGDTGSLVLVLWPVWLAGQSYGSYMVLERTRAFDGTSTADGYSLIYGNAIGSSSGNITQTTPSFLANGYVPSGTTPLVLPLNSSTQTAVVGGSLYPLPIFTGNNLKIGAPSQYIMGYPRGDIATALGGTISFTHYGSSKTWLPLGIGTTGTPGWASTAAFFPHNSFLIRLN